MEALEAPPAIAEWSEFRLDGVYDLQQVTIPIESVLEIRTGEYDAKVANRLIVRVLAPLPGFDKFFYAAGAQGAWTEYALPFKAVFRPCQQGDGE